MKVWVKLLIGSVLGMTIGFLLPNTEGVFSALSWFERLAIGIGRYAVIPVLVFSLTVAVYELRMDEQFWPMVLKNFLLIVAASFVVIFSGIIITSIFTPGRIPIETVEQIESTSLNVGANILELFPSNMLSVLSGNGAYLFPVCVFAFFLGMGLNYDRNYSKPVISLVDSLSRIFIILLRSFQKSLALY